MRITAERMVLYPKEYAALLRSYASKLPRARAILELMANDLDSLHEVICTEISDKAKDFVRSILRAYLSESIDWYIDLEDTVLEVQNAARQ
jgi:hypothetical protein